MKRITTIMAATILLAFAAGMAFAQQTSAQPGTTIVSTGDADLDAQVAELNAEKDGSALLAKLSVTFNVSLDNLNALAAQGYKPGEIWLALEMSKATGKSLTDVISLTKGKEGHGWGLVAQALGLKPGSDAFKALKANAKADKEKVGKGGSGAKTTDAKGQGGSNASGNSGKESPGGKSPEPAGQGNGKH